MATLEEDRELENARSEEIRRRVAEIDAGKVEMSPADQVPVELRAILEE